MKKRKILSLLISLCLLISLLPTVALAADQTNDGAGIRIVQGDAYDSSTGIFSIKVQAKLPVGTGISSVGILLSYDNTKLAVVNKNNTSKDVTSNEGVKKESEAIISKTLIQTVDDDENTKEYTLQDSAMYKAGDRSGIYTFHYNGKPSTQKATDAQTSGNWFDVYEVMFRVTGQPDDPATVLNSDSLRIADVAKGDDAVMEGAFPANNIYSIYLTDDSTPAKLYVLNEMSKCPDTEVTGEKSLMTAPDTGTATYPGSTNSGTPATYTVSFNANGGTGTMANVTGVTSSYTLPTCTFTAPTNKQFKGWATSASGTVITGTSITVTADTTLYAIWEPIPATTYTVSFNANGGTGTMADVTGVTSSYTLPACTFTAPSGQQFKGWAMSASGAVITGTSITVTADTTLYVIWEPIPATTYTVSFNANGGTGTMADVTNISGSYTLPANGFTAPSAKQFKAWSVGGVEKAAGDTITVNANTTVTAIWEPIPVTEYTITFNGNGGTPSVGTMSTAGGKLTSLPTATRSGSYSFDGWYTAASGGTQITTAYVFSANTTVYAHWTYTGGGGGSYYAPTVPDMPMLYSGCTGDAVKTLQEKLNAKGFDSGNVDGIFGAKTYAAATAFQKANGLGVDGIVGKLTWAKLYDATPVNVTPVTTQPMLRTGSRGDAVRKLQELLNAKGYTCGSVDGIFGSKTYAAVLAFQKANGLAADGIVGPLTWGKLV